LDKEYAGITGLPDFTKAAGELAYGEDSAPIKENRVSGGYFWWLSARLLFYALKPHEKN
jgi:hypothetical protein